MGDVEALKPLLPGGVEMTLHTNPAVHRPPPVFLASLLQTWGKRTWVNPCSAVAKGRPKGVDWRTRERCRWEESAQSSERARAWAIAWVRLVARSLLSRLLTGSLAVARGMARDGADA